MGLCDVFCAVEYFVLLFLVQRHASVFVQVWTKRIGRVQNLLTSSSHTLLWHVYQGSNGSCCAKTVLLNERHSGLTVEFQINGQLVCARTI